ncbi:metal ABC transporter solute-binding protein, Zn/Mn family [Pelagibacterium luteolum]|uniref:Manganese/zinc/iron transport system substrate-binding protein n=1 Tax=Pelagibacterium luteolum TaxID=440168 RepID=A0A1G7UZW6_9HYPH|nr:zinc ABC transporter substrate-binding protein [Pelagibacterium luteolum]SDG52828.1 manganese/zinc/iron transport system substrate-binding protein [Pelagibacterium luteolum]
MIVTFNRMKNILPATCLTLIVATSPATAQDGPNIVSTIGMIGDIAQTVGGDCVAVETMMGPGIDPHLYQATARDVQTLNRASLILYSGYGLEGQLADVFARYGERVSTLAVAEAGIADTEVIHTEGAYGIDPHLWMDVSLWQQTVPVLAEALSAIAPQCANEIATTAERYSAELTALHQWTGEAIASIPIDQRILITAHDAFAYYGRAYGIDVAGIQGISTQAEAAIADIRQVAALIAERSVPAIFVESTINPRTIQAVIEAANEEGQQVEIGGQLYSDAMGDTGTAAGTYIGMIHANTLAITEALGGTPPPLPAELSEWATQWTID